MKMNKFATQQNTGSSRGTPFEPSQMTPREWSLFIDAELALVLALELL